MTIGPFPQWGDKKKIVAMDPWGHLAPWLFKDTIEKDDGMSLAVSSWDRHLSDTLQWTFDRQSRLQKRT